MPSVHDMGVAPVLSSPAIFAIAGVPVLAATIDAATPIPSDTLPGDAVGYGRRRSIPWIGDAILIALFAFIQLGYTYYLSVASVAALWMLVRLRHQLFAGFRLYFWACLLPLPMLLSLLFENSPDPTQDFLRVGREAIILVLMVVILGGATLRTMRLNRKRFVQSTTALALFLVGLTVLQVYALRSKVYFGIPAEYFTRGQGTIPDELDLYYSSIRAAGTFSEPSYFAFILLSMLMVAMARFDHDRKGAVLAAIVITTGILSQAASFILFASLIGTVFLMRSLRGGARIFFMAAIPIAATFLLVLGSDSGTLARVQGGASATGDSSIFARIIGPLQILPDYLLAYPAGAPLSILPDILQPFTAVSGAQSDQFLMNGLFNLFFEYGLLGLPLLIVLLWRRDFVVNLYIICCMMFNGAFLSTDKLAVICVTVAAYQAIRRRDPRMPSYRPLPSAAADGMDRGRNGPLRSRIVDTAETQGADGHGHGR